MKAYALLGGPKEDWPKNIKDQFQSAKNSGDLIIGVDRGARLLQELGVDPDLAVGDFDSLNKKELSNLESIASDIRYSNPVKDDTDSELMLKIAFNDYHVTQLCIFGATGGRLDHLLINIFTFLNPELRNILDKVSIIDKQNKIIYLKPGTNYIEKQNGYKYFAVANLSGVKDLHIINARYLLKNYSSEYPRFFSSNEFLVDSNYVQIKFKKGLVAVIFSKDIDRFQNVE